MTNEQTIDARRDELKFGIMASIAHSGLPTLEQTQALAEVIATFVISMAAVTEDHTAKACAEYLNKGVEIFLGKDAEEKVVRARQIIKAMNAIPKKLDS